MTSDGTYPDKNIVADSITTSIITNRFLVEAALMPWSMAIHFTDIASVHILILKVCGESNRVILYFFYITSPYFLFSYNFLV